MNTDFLEEEPGYTGSLQDRGHLYPLEGVQQENSHFQSP